MSTPLTESAVFIALKVVLEATTGVKAKDVIRARTTLPTQSDPYIAMRRLASTGKGRAFEGDPGEYSQHRMLSVQVDAVGDAAICALQDAHLLLASRSPVLEALSISGVGVGAVGPMVDRSRIAPTGHEPVAGFDLDLSYVQIVRSGETPIADLVRLTLEAVGGDELGPATIDEVPAGSLPYFIPASLPVLPFLAGVFSL